MSARFTQVGRARALAMYADWTDRVARGELPSAAPSRPQGRERNVVITMWDFGTPKTYLHDEISSDKRNPTVNPNGPIYGATEESTQFLPVVNPADNSATQVPLVLRDPKTPSAADQPHSCSTPDRRTHGSRFSCPSPRPSLGPGTARCRSPGSGNWLMSTLAWPWSHSTLLTAH
jgi:hypothetical protein